MLICQRISQVPPHCLQNHLAWVLASLEGSARVIGTASYPTKSSLRNFATEPYDQLIQQLRVDKAVGAVVAVNRELIWADVFASPSLLERYWPKLIRSYAAEAMAPHAGPAIVIPPPSAEDALRFMKRLNATHENVETEPSVYQNTEMSGDDFEAFVLISLLPKTGFDVHEAKMKR